MRWKQVGLAGLLAPCLGGCNIYYYAAHNLVNETATVCGEQALTHELRKDAKSAWREVRCQFPRRMFTEEFHDGFLDGYTDYLDRGGNASLPAVPPVHYTRNKKYFTPEGQARLKDYFLGFQYGVDVAVATGCRQFLTVPVLLPQQDPGPPSFNVQPGGVPAVGPGPGIGDPGRPVVIPAPPAVVVPPESRGAGPVRFPEPKAADPAPAGPKPVPAPRPTPDFGTAEPGGSKFGGSLPPPGPSTSAADDPLPRPYPSLPIPMRPDEPADGPVSADDPGSKFGSGPVGGRPAFTVRLPEPPDEVPVLPEGIPTPSVRDDLPVIPPNHVVPAPLPPNHAIPGRN
jgi:hypothetical protein